jgi:hypothetical protein
MSISAMKQALEALENSHAYLPVKTGVEREADQAITALRQAIAEAEKQEPLVWMNKYGHVASFKNDEYTAPLYTAPVHASDISQERVDETAKSKHEPLEQCSYPKCQATNGCVGVCSKGQPDLARVGEVGVWGDKREWVGLEGDIPGLGLVTEEFYNGMLCAEDILRKRNT